VAPEHKVIRLGVLKSGNMISTKSVTHAYPRRFGQSRQNYGIYNQLIMYHLAKTYLNCIFLIQVLK